MALHAVAFSSHWAPRVLRRASLVELGSHLRLTLTVTAEVVCNQMLGPILFKAAIISVGEAHNTGEAHKGDYAPGQTPPPIAHSAASHPSPRCALVVADRADASADALVGRLTARS